MSVSRILATGLLVVFLTTSVRAEDDTVTAVLKSAGAKGGEVAAKALAGLLYDTSCKGMNLDQATGYICKVLGSVSGRTEDEWKADVTKQLKEISTKLDTIEAGQRQIQKELDTQHKVMEARFKQVSTEVVAGTHLVRIEALWEKYEAQFDKVDADVTRDSMISFAKEIMKSEPHTILADLNIVLTRPILEGQSLVRYPFYEWRLKNERRMIHELNTMELYEFAEKKFVDFRMRQQKAYVMYLWAATVLETQCKFNPQQCTQPARSTSDFNKDYDRYTRQQVEAFNASVDWFVLNYSQARTTVTGNFVTLNDGQAMFLRANFLTSSMLTSNEGLWGRVISMGNKWNGSLQVTCGGATQTLTPFLKYSVPVAGSGMMNSGPDSGPFDWWVSTKGNSTYDEVRFADNWQMYQYHLPAAKAGPCTIPQNQPNTGYLPWVPASTNVVTVKTFDDRSFPFGSFVAIQRAGGSYALLSGSDWTGSTTPERIEDGAGQREKVDYDWYIEPNHPTGPRIGLYMKGRGEFKVSNGSSRIHNRSSILIKQSKAIRFPDDSTVKLRYYPAYCNGRLCTEPGNTSLLSYDIENNDTESKKGKLDSIVAVTFRNFDGDDSTGQGVVINGSYGKTGDRKKHKVSGEQVGVVNTRPGNPYRLTYSIYFDLETEGRGLDATEYMYSALLGTGSVFVAK